MVEKEVWLNHKIYWRPERLISCGWCFTSFSFLDLNLMWNKYLCEKCYEWNCCKICGIEFKEWEVIKWYCWDCNIN